MPPLSLLLKLTLQRTEFVPLILAGAWRGTGKPGTPRPQPRAQRRQPPSERRSCCVAKDQGGVPRAAYCDLSGGQVGQLVLFRERVSPEEVEQESQQAHSDQRVSAAQQTWSLHRHLDMHERVRGWLFFHAAHHARGSCLQQNGQVCFYNAFHRHFSAIYPRAD